MTPTPDSFATGPMWAGFIVFVLAMLALDLFVFGGKTAHRVKVKDDAIVLDIEEPQKPRLTGQKPPLLTAE